MALDITLWMRDELARRKDLYRDRFAGKPLARVPVDVRVCVPSPAPCTVQEQFRDGDKQLEAALANACATWEYAPSGDGIPAIRPDVIVVPVFTLSPKDDPEALCRDLRAVATEYARRMDWGWAP